MASSWAQGASVFRVGPSLATDPSSPVSLSEPRWGWGAQGWAMHRVCPLQVGARAAGGEPAACLHSCRLLLLSSEQLFRLFPRLEVSAL